MGFSFILGMCVSCFLKMSPLNTETFLYELLVINTNYKPQLQEPSIPCLWFVKHCQVVSRGSFWLEHGLLYFLLHDQVLRRLWLQVSGLLCHEQCLAPERKKCTCYYMQYLVQSPMYFPSWQDTHFK